MNPRPHIQEGTKTDVPDLIRIMQANAGAPRWTPAQVVALFKSSSAVRRVVLVAKQDGAVDGFVVLSLAAAPDLMEAELESIAVSPDKQRQGIGRALLDAAHIWALRQGAACLRLEVRQNNTAALGLYTECGWSRVGLRRGYYVRPSEDAVLMERTLAPGGSPVIVDVAGPARKRTVS